MSSSQIQEIAANVSSYEPISQDFFTLRGSGDSSLHSDDRENRDISIDNEMITLVERNFQLGEGLTLAGEEAVNMSLYYALENGMMTQDAFADMEFTVFEITEEAVDVLDVGIDTQPSVVGYVVLAIDKNDESHHEHVEEDGLEEMRNKYSFSAVIDGQGVCSVSSSVNYSFR